jgi:hypothetical protein
LIGLRFNPPNSTPPTLTTTRNPTARQQHYKWKKRNKDQVKQNNESYGFNSLDVKLSSQAASSFAIKYSIDSLNVRLVSLALFLISA